MNGSKRRAGRRYAWLALGLAGAAVAVPVVVGGLRGLVAVGIALAGTAVTLAALWWLLAYRGWVRLVAAGLVVVVPVSVAAAFVTYRLIWLVLLSTALWLAAAAAGRTALGRVDGMAAVDAPAPRRPFLVMNARSGGGKVGRYRLAERARELGAEVAVFDGAEPVDVAALARDAVARGADLLGVAGGDGTQARVAAVAAEYDLPFVVLAAGTRNHFALDLGLDGADPAGGLAALTDGVEIRVDLGRCGGRTFVNNASFGAYADLVRSPSYRQGRTRTALRLLPDLLTGNGRRRDLTARTTGLVVRAPQALLVSNNPYGAEDLAGLGRRARLDGGRLGLLAVTVHSAAQAADLIRGRYAPGIVRLAADRVTIDADGTALPVGLDGEPAWVRPPVTCVIEPGVLRVRLPRGVRRAPVLDWSRLRRLATR